MNTSRCLVCTRFTAIDDQNTSYLRTNTNLSYDKSGFRRKDEKKVLKLDGIEFSKPLRELFNAYTIFPFEALRRIDGKWN